MSKLSEALQVRQGSQRRIDDFNRPVQVTMGETGHVRDYTPDANIEWFLEAKVQVTFWANHAQRADAERAARRMLMHHLYSDVLAELAYLRSAVSDGDRCRCFASLDRIDRTIQGGL